MANNHFSTPFGGILFFPTTKQSQKSKSWSGSGIIIKWDTFWGGSNLNGLNHFEGLSEIPYTLPETNIQVAPENRPSQ